VCPNLYSDDTLVDKNLRSHNLNTKTYTISYTVSAGENYCNRSSTVNEEDLTAGE